MMADWLRNQARLILPPLFVRLVEATRSHLCRPSMILPYRGWRSDGFA